MKITPRAYQQEAHDAVIDWFKKSTSPCLVEAATGSGKSVIVSMIAETLHELSGGKRVLCLAPSADLVLQNAEKFETTGYPFSIYSASAGQKSLRHPVIFATPLTFKKVARRLATEFTGVVIDECHGITESIKTIIEDMRSGNPSLRVCGLTATPYRMGEGFVFAEDHKGNTISEHQARDPYFAKQVYEIGAKYLINQGFLTPPVVGCINAERYDTSGLVVQSNGSFSSKSVDQAFVGWGRKTAAIVADVVSQSQDRDGVMIFAATVDHAKEVLASLPPDLSRMIGGDVNTKKDDRRRLVNDFKVRKFKYLVSVGTMTTGVDFIHVSVIAVLRRTESVSLFQQIIGRGMRLCDGKDNFLLLDYAGNIEALCPDGDLFAPEIKAAYHSDGKTFINAECEECGAVNKFSARENPDDLDIDTNGYFLDIDGDRIESEYGFVPAHYGRRCCGMVKSGHEYVRCSHYWTSKECPTCQHMNDITARRCESCRTELINPNDKLIADFKIQKRDPSMLQTDELLQMEVIPTVSRAGNKMVRVEMMTTERSFDVFLMPEHANDWVRSKHDKFYEVTDGYTVKPRTVTYKKEESGMYDIKGYNLPSDKEQLKQELLKGGYTGEI